jgi:hypothetical protein
MVDAEAKSVNVMSKLHYVGFWGACRGNTAHSLKFASDPFLCIFLLYFASGCFCCNWYPGLLQWQAMYFCDWYQDPTPGGDTLSPWESGKWRRRMEWLAARKVGGRRNQGDSADWAAFILNHSPDKRGGFGDTCLLASSSDEGISLMLKGGLHNSPKFGSPSAHIF